MTEPIEPQPSDAAPEPTFVSRGGLKLHRALTELPFDPIDMLCADFGCSTGGFTDCLLQHGAKHVHSIDTAYGEFAWKLRTDDRVTIHERSNALHLDPPPEVVDAGGIDLGVIDLGWTKQARALDAAAKWLKPGGHIISLVKPHYEADKADLGEGGLLDPEYAQEVAERVRDSLPELGTPCTAGSRARCWAGPWARSGRRRARGTRSGWCW